MWQIEGCWHANTGISDNGDSTSVTWQSAISKIGSALHHAMMPL